MITFSGYHKATDAQMLVVRSNKLLAIGVWQPIRIGVSGRKVMLSVDGIVNSGLLQAGEIIPLGGSSIYIGEWKVKPLLTNSFNYFSF